MRFTIDLDLGDLRERLLRTRWPDQADAGLQEVVRYWAGGFDWPAQQARLNRLEHHIVDGIHFVHAKGGANAIPLMLIHGWPGSFVEFVDIIPLLQGPFELIIPSLPGYGFSTKPSQPGMSNARIAELFLQLMTHLGHERFVAQGDDWGAGVTTWMAVKAPQRLSAIHLNYIPGSYAPPIGAPLTAEEEQFLEDKARWGEEHGAYGHVQRTRPLTLAYGLNDSPAALAAWILEKFREWADPASKLSIDHLLTNITIYWATETIHSSVCLYRESATTPLRNVRMQMPTAVAHFPLDAPFPPRSYSERGYDLRSCTEQPAGGHFAALEQPELLAKDIREFLGV